MKGLYAVYGDAAGKTGIYPCETRCVGASDLELFDADGYVSVAMQLNHCNGLSFLLTMPIEAATQIRDLLTAGIIRHHAEAR